MYLQYRNNSRTGKQNGKIKQNKNKLLPEKERREEEDERVDVVRELVKSEKREKRK